jgi:hypothetical protein
MALKMRLAKTFLTFISAAFLLGLAGCAEEEAPAPPPRTTGGLVVRVRLTGSTGFLTGVNVGLATSQSNLDRSVYLQDKVTDNTGKADFGQLNPGNYYYDAYHVIGTNEYYGEGQVQIVAGKDLDLTLQIRN